MRNILRGVHQIQHVRPLRLNYSLFHNYNLLRNFRRGRLMWRVLRVLSLK